jgi:N-acetylneuraminic acid mutarotase
MLIRHKLTCLSIISLILLVNLAAFAPAFASADYWSSKASTPFHTSITPGGAAVLDGKIYVIGYGGGNQSSTPQRLEVYDPATDAWTTKASLPRYVDMFTAAECQGEIYVLCSFFDRIIANTLYAYNPSTDTWTTKTHLSTSLINMQANSVNEKIYVAGGEMLIPPTPRPSLYGNPQQVTHNASATNWVYDPETDSWSTAAPLPVPVMSYASAVLDNKIYFIGGASMAISNSGDPIVVPYRLMQVYDPQTNQWSQGTAMPTDLSGMAACAISSVHRIYLEGGETRNYTAQNQIEIFDLQTGNWYLGASMTLPRIGVSLAATNDKVYAIGGETMTSSNPSISFANEEYTPDLGAPASALLTPAPTIQLPLGTLSPAQLQGQEKMMSFLGNVLGLDMSRYQVTRNLYSIGSSSGAEITEDQGTVYLNAGTSNQISSMGIFDNGYPTLITARAEAGSLLYISNHLTDKLAEVKNFLSRYRSFAETYGISTSELSQAQSMLNNIQQLVPTDITQDNMRMQITISNGTTTSNAPSTSTRFFWDWVSAPLEAKRKCLSLSFFDAAEDSEVAFGDSWGLYSLETTCISEAQAKSIAWNAAQNYNVTFGSANGSTYVMQPNWTGGFSVEFLNMGAWQNDTISSISGNSPGSKVRSSLTLYPIWAFQFFFGKSINRIMGIQVSIWGDTGDIMHTGTTSSYSGGSQTPIITPQPNITVVLNGNVSASQISTITMQTNSQNSETELTFTVTGEEGTEGFCNMTIPKNSIPPASNPTVNIDGAQASEQGYTQDSNSYYVWFTTHFSTHQVTITFTEETSSKSPSNTEIAIIATVAVIAVVLVWLALWRWNSRS